MEEIKIIKRSLVSEVPPSGVSSGYFLGTFMCW